MGSELTDLQFGEIGARIEQRRLDRRAAELRAAGRRQAERMRESATFQALQSFGADLETLADDLDGWEPDLERSREYDRYVRAAGADPRD